MSNPIRDAKKRIKKKRKFFNELASYVGTSLFLIGLNVFVTKGYMWAWWPVGIWGVSLIFKAFGLIVNDKTSEWERKAVRKEIESMGYDPDLYEDEELDLEELVEKRKMKKPLYRDNDLV